MARDTLRAEVRAQDDADRELSVDPADEGSPAFAIGTARQRPPRHPAWCRNPALAVDPAHLDAHRPGAAVRAGAGGDSGLVAAPEAHLTAPVRVREFIANNPQLGAFYDAIGVFDVYASPWFAAIYLLLFVSLVGCIRARIPGCTCAGCGPNRRAPAQPRPAARPPAAGVSGDSEAVLATAEQVLRGRRFGVRRLDDSVGMNAATCANWATWCFTCRWCFCCAAWPWGRCSVTRAPRPWSKASHSSSTLTQFDDFQLGRAVQPRPVGAVHRHARQFHRQVRNRPGAARRRRVFLADTTALDGVTTQQQLEVNHPLVLGDSVVHLVGHGYAVDVTVRTATATSRSRGR